MKNKVAYDGCGEEARESQDVGKSVDVFVGSQLFEGIEYRPLGICWGCAVEMSESIRLPHMLNEKMEERSEGVTWQDKEPPFGLGREV
jgi:hypothetical protein